MSAFHQTYRIEARSVFDSLVKNQETTYAAYAHHLSRACWHGSRIVLRQTSLEAEGIFDFIIELHRACNGRWDDFLNLGIGQEELNTWLDFAGMFLSSLGNYFGDGDRKVIPDISEDTLHKLGSISPGANGKLKNILHPMLSAQPAIMGYLDDNCQSSYYLGTEQVTRAEIDAIKKIMHANKVAPENTRLRKYTCDTSSVFDKGYIFEILQASAEKDPEPQLLGYIRIGNHCPSRIFLKRGDYAAEMANISAETTEARKYATTEEQKTALSHLIESFNTGMYQAFRSAQEIWVKDKAPLVEHCMGFLFGYRDPYGARAEWQGAVGIAHSEETTKTRQLVCRIPEFMRTFPWAIPNDNDGKGPFEPSEPDLPDFTIIHLLASASSTVWEATNLTIDREHGERCGIKSIVFGNRMSLNSSPGRPCYYVQPSEAQAYMGCAHTLRFVGTVIHEIMGHGSGKLLVEGCPGKFNFDRENPPVSPITGLPIRTWYRPGETWNSVFGELAPTVEECRAFLVANYMADNKDVLALFGIDQDSTLTADDFTYYSYLHIGVEGLRALSSFDAKTQVWGGDHARAQFAILKHILQDGDGVMWIEHDSTEKTLFVHVDRSRIMTHGKPSIGRMMSKIQIWRSTADISACRPFYESLSIVDGQYEVWRQIVASNPEPKWKFVQPNTFLRDDGTIELREYEESNIGIIKSFFERNI